MQCCVAVRATYRKQQTPQHRMEGRGRRRGVDSFVLWSYPIWVQFNLPTTATLGTEERGHCKEVAVVERLKKEWMYGLSAKKKKKNGRCRQVAVSGSSTVQCVNNFVADCRRCRYVACFFLFWSQISYIILVVSGKLLTSSGRSFPHSGRLGIRALGFRVGEGLQRTDRVHNYIYRWRIKIVIIIVFF